VGRSGHDEVATAHFRDVEGIAADSIGDVMFVALASLWRLGFVFPHVVLDGVLEAVQKSCKHDFSPELAQRGE
jgi:hypothetical protein